MDKPWTPDTIAICVPVRNEEALLPRMLHAIAALDRPAGAAVALCVLLDACSDASGAILSDAGAWFPFPIVRQDEPCAGAPNAGRARAGAMALGQRATVGASQAMLLTTDADSWPARDWLTSASASLQGCDVVAGRIVREGGADPIQDRLDAYLDRLHALRRAIDPVAWEGLAGHHHQVGGANLGFRADAYAALGGFAAIASGEDAAIVDAAHRQGLRVRRDRAVVVHTSSRRQGRAPGGLADHLRALEAAPELPLVTNPEDAAWQYRGHALARASFGVAGAMAGLARSLGTAIDHVDRIAERAANGEAFATLVVPAAPGGPRLTGLAEAEAILAGLELALLDRAA